MMKFTRMTAAALLCLLLLASCGEEGKTSVTTDAQTDTKTTTSTVDTEEYNGPVLPDADFNNETFTFFNANTADWMAINTVTAEEGASDALNDAVYRRNLEVEERYNINIEEYQMEDDPVKFFMTAISSGDTTYDIGLLESDDALTVVLENAAIEFTEIPYVNLEAEWWLQDSLESMSIGGKYFYGINTFDTTHYDGSSALYFNKTLVANYDMEDPYELVREGKWTIDKMKEMGMMVADDVNGDSKWDENDMYGYSSHERLSSRYLMAGCNAPLSLSKDDNDLPYFDMDTEYYIDRLLKVTSIINDGEGFVNPYAESENNGGYENFLAGRCLFYNETLGNAQKLRQMTLDFGILPAPKYDEAQENYYNDVVEAYFMVVPVTNQDLERTGIIIESLAYESLDTVKVAAYDGMLQGVVSRDTESEEMLDLMFDNLSFTIPVAEDYVMGDMYERIYKNKRDFASYFQKKEARIQKKIDEAIEAYEDNY